MCAGYTIRIAMSWKGLEISVCLLWFVLCIVFNLFCFGVGSVVCLLYFFICFFLKAASCLHVLGQWRVNLNCTNFSTLFPIFLQNLNNKEPATAESRWRPGLQGRGGRGGRVNFSPRHMPHGEQPFQTKTSFRIISWKTLALSIIFNKHGLILLQFVSWLSQNILLCLC